MPGMGVRYRNHVASMYQGTVHRATKGMVNKMHSDEVLKAETMWFHVFKDMIDSGDMAKLDGGTVKVYFVIKSYTNFSTGHAFPSLELIAEKSGISVRQVKRCIADLEQSGYISKAKEGRHNTYKLREKIVIKNDSGTPQAVATWDYLPGAVKDTVADLKNVLVTGDFAGAKIISIQNLTLNILQSHGDHAINVVNSEVGDLQKLKALKK